MNVHVAEVSDMPNTAVTRRGYLISREISIDAGHRVTFHRSKCANLHGHRYRVQAWCRGPLFGEGEQSGMVLDFGFLKEEMMALIDAGCDHAFVFWADDQLCRQMFGLEDQMLAQEVERGIKRDGYFAGLSRGGLKICVLPFVPTAENLAYHWFNQLQPRVRARSNHQADLVYVKVWETPNCWAAYGPEKIVDI
jgi:6-pyruvoyltetrahydropterin/6-carboxytetrahydropterin synthase